MPLATLRDVVLSVQEGRVERALAPVENALEGGVDPVLDTLALEAPDVALIGEVLQPVSYCLAAGRELALSEITVVRSHPQALGQCKRWLAEHVPDAAVVPAASTADAVREVAGEPDGTWAAIGPRLAARRYGAVMLAEDLEDDPGNVTRFAWLRAPRTRRRRPRAARRRRRWCSGARVRAPRAGSSRASPCSPSPASTSPGSSRARCAGAWASTCSSSTSRARRPTRRCPARSTACAVTPRWFESSGASQP